MSHNHNKPQEEHLKWMRLSITIGIPVIIAIASPFVGKWDDQSGAAVLFIAGALGGLFALFNLFAPFNKEIKTHERIWFAVLALVMLALSIIFILVALGPLP